MYEAKKIMNTSWICVSSLHSNHANLCIVQILLLCCQSYSTILLMQEKKQKQKQPTIVFLGSVPPHDDKMKISEGKKPK